MISEQFDNTNECSFPFSTEYRRHTLSTAWQILLTLLILLYVLILALPAFAATEAVSVMPSSINRALPGSRTGVLTSAQGPVLQINRDMYRLAPTALVEDKHGTALSVQDLKWQDVEFRVQYWTASELGPNHISHLIINFPE